MAKKDERIDPAVIQALAEELGVPADLELLSDIETRIDKNLLEYGRIKVEILKDLALIYTNRRFLFISDHNAKYLNDFASYIKDRFKQGRSTYYGDAKVVKMLVAHKETVEKNEILKKSENSLVYILRKISTVEDPVPLLEDIDKFDRKPEPSGADIKITKRLTEVGKIIGISVLDHVIIGDGYYSFVDEGTLPV
jgi:hypothetical protein